MKNDKNRYFTSKLLLFGEYTIIKGSQALAIPFDKFKGKWSFVNSADNEILKSFARYLNRINWESYDTNFDFDRFSADIEKGLIFSSDIPIGYGVGSSGALSAAIYNMYFDDLDKDTDVLKTVLAKIESFFHGSSSGIDPMVSFLNQSILILDESNLKKIKKSNFNFKSYKYYLIDTKISRETKKYVDVFNDKCKEIEFVENCLEPMIKLNEKIISSYLENKENYTFNLIHEISNYQYKYFKEMIIPSLKLFWKKSLETQHTKIKLCGAGGGGFYLLISKKQLSELDELKEFNLIPIEF